MTDDLKQPDPMFDRLPGAGKMATLMRQIEWSKTPIGPIENWSPSFKMMVTFLLANRFPLLLWWGPQYISIYNDAYIPILGNKHPNALGQPVSEVWEEIWPILQPLIDTPYHGGPSTWIEDFQLELRRSGFAEEAHFTVAYSPVPDELAPNGIGGVLATVHEITEKIIGERRIVLLRDLGTQATEAKTAEEACGIAADTLSKHPKDIPFALLYLIDHDAQQARLASACGIAKDSLMSAPLIKLSEEVAPNVWPLSHAVDADAMQIVEDLCGRFGNAAPAGPWSDPPAKAAIVPIRSNLAHRFAGLLVIGISSRLRLDDSYRSFIELATGQIATAIANARAHEEERKRAEALAELDRAKTAFFSNVSHEFRTPLTLMLGPLEDTLAEGEPLPAERRESLEVVHRNSLRLLKLVNTLLDFSRIEAGRIEAVYELTDLAAFTADLASVFRSAIERAGMKLVVQCSPLAEPVYVDREMWEKIVLNLISNAFKFTLQGEIEVSLNPAGENVELIVRDTGIGITADEIPHLFERFHRVKGARGRTFEGTGIGLALVHELTKLHRGSVRVESKIQQGSRFIVSIPFGKAHLPPEKIESSRTLVSSSVRGEAYVEEALRWLPDQPARQHESLEELTTSPVSAGRAVAGTSGPMRRILLADDNADMRDYLGRLLRQRYEVDAVADGLQAIQAARKQKPDLVLTDVMMPGLDGLGLLRELRADPQTATVPVIFLSARAGEEARVEGLEAGADDYLIKPFTAKELLARVRAHLEIAHIRTEAEGKLREKESFAEAVMENMGEGLYTVDDHGLVTTMNPAAEKLFGWKLEELRGKKMHDATHYKHRDGSHFPAEECPGLEVLQKGKTMTGLEDTFIRKDGTFFDVIYSSSRIWKNDSVSGLVVVFRDVTESKRAAESLRSNEERYRASLHDRHLELQQALASAEQASRLKDEFLATISHELRTPLNAILGWSHMLQSKAIDAEVSQSALNAVYASAKNQAQIIEDLLDVSSIISGKLQLQAETIVLVDVLTAAITTVDHAVNAKGIRLDLQFARGVETLSLFADPQRLQQVFWNLLSNAVKFTPQGGKIEIQIIQTPTEVILVFRDNGIGIKQEFVPYVFERFRQADSSTTRRFGGLGLGLSITKNILELHGGTISVESEEGKGTAFIVTLPRFSNQDIASPPPPFSSTTVDSPQGYGINLSGRRILLVDDDEQTLQLMEQAFQQAEAEFRTSSSATLALNVLKEWTPQLLISDIAMPDYDGYWLIRQLRSLSLPSSNIPAIALTAYASAKDREAVLAAGFQMFVSKPVEPAELLATAKALLESEFFRSGERSSLKTAPSPDVSRKLSTLAGKKILLVEDDLISTEMLRVALQRVGVEFRSAANAAKALDHLQEWLPDVIISDLGLPDEDGYELMRKIRAIPAVQRAGIPAVALTGYGKEEGTRAIAEGFHTFKSKPLEPEDLLSLLTDLLKP